jgi:hypothetical protein
MRNMNRLFISLLPWTASRQGSRMRLRKWILGLSLAAALLSWGCPKQDPLQAFNPPAPPPIDQGPAPVPEPATALLFGAALLIGGAIVRRRRNGGPK